VISKKLPPELKREVGVHASLMNCEKGEGYSIIIVMGLK